MSSRILHILFDGPDETASRLIKEHTASGREVDVIDLTTTDMTDSDLVDRIFGSDKVISWHKRS